MPVFSFGKVGSRFARRRALESVLKEIGHLTSRIAHTESLPIFIDGLEYEITADDLWHHHTLSQFIHTHVGRSAREVCGEGGCGACSVIVTRPYRSQEDPSEVRLETYSVATCITPIGDLAFASIRTPQSTSSDRAEVSTPAQEALQVTNAAQCGFCTGGIVSVLDSECAGRGISCKDVETLLDGNLCRCTGYRTISEAAQMLCEDYDGTHKEKAEAIRERAKGFRSELVSNRSFPETLRKSYKSYFCADNVDGVALVERPDLGDDQRLVNSHIRPASLEALARCYADHPEATEVFGAGGSKKWENRTTLTGGFTDIGVDEREAQSIIHHTVSVRDVPELRGWRIDPDGSLVLGAAVSISEMTRISDALKEDTDAFAAHKVSLQALRTQARYFANENVRHTGSIGGGLASCHHLSDMVPVWVALDARIEVLSHSKGARSVSVTELLDVEEARLRLEIDEIIVSIVLPPRDPNQFVAEAFKQAIRRTDSMALVSAAMTATRDGSGVLTDARLVFGGLGAPGLRARATEALLNAQNCQSLAEDDDALGKLLDELRSEIEAINVRALPQDMRDYQREVAAGFLRRFIHMSAPNPSEFMDTNRFRQPPSRGRQIFEANTDKEAIIGRALTHRYLPQHTHGETHYTIDAQLSEEGLHAAIVPAPIASGTLLQIDASLAEGERDYVGLITAKDVPGSNLQGHMVHPLAEEEILCSSKITHFGQPVALVLARTEFGARRAAAKVRVIAESDTKSPVFSFDDIVDHDSWFSFEHLPDFPENEAKERRLARGDTSAVFEKAVQNNDRYLTLSGREEVGAQSCFYLEPQCAVAVPQSDERVEIRSSTQSPSHVARYVAAALGIEQHKVDVVAGFIGGGFGGKQTRSASFAAMAAVAARKMDRTVKIELSRETDMTLVPGRSPFRADYKIVLDRQTGAIEALQIDMIVNGGSAEDYSPSIAETSIFLIDNAYHIANADIRARCGRSNLPAGFTATRGYGKPQTGAIIEKILDDAAAQLNIDPQHLRKTNLYTRGQKALAETPIDDDVLRSCWTSAVDGNYAEWRRDCTSFNAENGMVKRGVAGIPSKGNMGFLEASDINRGSAIVRLHSDGSVRISHSGVEMGQGLNTRMSQVASYGLNIPIEKVTIDPTRTSDLPNTPPTTMVATDMIGAAIMNACDELLEKLARAGYPESATFSEATQRCYDEGWPMEATGHAQEPRLRFDWEKQQGNVSYFFVWGAALAEAEIDLGTGSWRILRTHITQDCGTSLNPMLDIGQVEGGFAFGVGYSLLEKMIYREDGSLLTDNVSSYKIPSIDDMPRDWTIEILQETQGPPGRRGLHNSKGVGEANIQLGFSAYFAVKDAIRSARRERGLDPNAFSLPFPAMPHDILKACGTNSD